MYWQTARHRIDLSRPKVMGIVNVTPDSFSDGGSHDGDRAALAHCERLLSQGADILDIGGESTRPGAPQVDADGEWARIADVLRAAVSLGVPVSVDTYKPEIMKRALDMFIVEGVYTSIPLHKRILEHPEFVDGHLDTSFLVRTGLIAPK